MKRILFTTPFVHIDNQPVKDEYEVEYLNKNATQEEFVKHLNDFEPNAIFFKHDAASGKLTINKENFFGKLSQQALGSLVIISNHGVGYDKINAEDCTSNNVWLTNLPDVVSDATADIAMFLILNCARKASFFEQSLRRGEWNAGGNVFGFDLKNKTLGIVGLGSIGKRLAKRAQVFGMNIIYFNRKRLDSSEEAELQLSSDAYCSSLHDLLSRSDLISIHTPLTPTTRHLISTEEFKQMKPTCYVINTSRGAVIDEQALIQALESGQIAGCGLDVFEHEPKVPDQLLNLQNVVLLPHIGTQSKDTRIEMETLCLDNIKRVLTSGQDPLTPVPEQQSWRRKA